MPYSKHADVLWDVLRDVLMDIFHNDTDILTNVEMSTMLISVNDNALGICSNTQHIGCVYLPVWRFEECTETLNSSDVHRVTWSSFPATKIQV